MLLHGEVGEEGVDLVLPHLGWMPQVVEPDEAQDPQRVGLLGASAVVAGAQRRPELVDESRQTASPPTDHEASPESGGQGV